MPWWQTVLMWSGGVAWAIIVLATLLAFLGSWQMKRMTLDDIDPEFALEDLEHEAFDHGDYTWVYTQDGSKPPIRVPNELAQRAADLMNRDSSQDFMDKTPPLVFTVPIPVIRAAMLIAQEEPDIEVALATWMANHIRFRS